MLVLDDRRIPASGIAAAQDIPPPLDLELTDGDRRIGRIHGTTIRFRGFADDVEAAHAAWVAWRAVMRRIARLRGERPVPIDIEPITVVRATGAWKVMAAGEQVATLVLPQDAGDPDEGSVAFEIEAPAGSDELTMRSLARLAYRTLRRSGLRWELMMPARTTTGATRHAGHTVAATGRPPQAEPPAPAPRPARPFASLIGSIVAVAVLLAVGLRVLAGKPSSIYVPGMIGTAIAGTAIILWGARHFLEDDASEVAAAPAQEAA